MAFVFPIQLEYLSLWEAMGIFAALATPVVLLGVWSLNGLGRARKWVAIGLRLAVLLGLVLLLGGVRWQREHKDVEVMVIRDLSDSTSYVKEHPLPTLRESVNDFMQQAMKDPKKPMGDRMGVIGFAQQAAIETLPSTALDLGSKAVMEGGSGTDAAAAIQLALASMSTDAMHRMLLVWDGNATAGNLEQAVEAAAAQGVPIDVMPLRYKVDSAVMMDRLVAPTWRRQNEPVTLDVIVRSTAEQPVRGTLVILHQGKPVDLDADTPGMQPSRKVTLQPGANRFTVKVPPLGGGIHAFRAVVELDAAAGAKSKPTLVTASMDGFTIVEGEGSVLYVDNVPQGEGSVLAQALKPEGINLVRAGLDDIPRELFAFQNYDAVVLANVPNGAGGVDQEQDKVLASYVHDMGGGLVMVGGPETFGAGGWQGSNVEKVLPVNMDVPARKEVGKGALVMVVHACEFPEGNYWGTQCVIKAIDALSQYDEVGIITYAWRNSGGSQWDFPLQAKGDGVKAKAAAKQMQQGDMPSFEDSMKVALYGSGGQKGLKDSDARHKHVIVISDGDPAPPSQELMDAYRAAKVSVSTVSVYPHDLSAQGLPPAMRMMAEQLKGKAYGPIKENFNQLPQIFIKEATVIRRTLIFEDSKGIPLQLKPTLSDVVQGLGADLPPVYGLVLTSRKPDPLVDMPIVAGKQGDPLLATWQTGLGRSAVFTSDATRKWAPGWVGSPSFGKFWAQVIRSVARPPMSKDMDIQTRVEGDKILVRAEAMDRDKRSMNFLNVSGQIIGPDMKARDIQLNQTGPGVYEATIEKAQAGAHIARLSYTGPKGEAGWQVAGVAINENPEMRDLKSNEAVLAQIAAKTGGRVLDPFDAAGADLFRREGLKKTASPMPVWDVLLPIVMGLMLADVAVRRIAWDFGAIMAALGRWFASFRAHRREKSESVDALRRLREGGAKQEEAAVAASRPQQAAAERPDAGRKFEGRGVEGDLNKIVGGASAEAKKTTSEKPKPDGSAGPAEHTSGLLAAKRRARNQMDKNDQE